MKRQKEWALRTQNQTMEESWPPRSFPCILFLLLLDLFFSLVSHNGGNMRGEGSQRDEVERKEFGEKRKK